MDVIKWEWSVGRIQSDCKRITGDRRGWYNVRIRVRAGKYESSSV